MLFRSNAMGIVRLSGRGGVRLSPDRCDRAGPRELSEALGVDQAHEVVSTSVVDAVDTERARHSPADRPLVRRDPWLEGKRQVAS